MRKAIAEAEVGDDVYGEDPTVRRLEERIAGMLGKEAALFVSSGTMGNQIAIWAQTMPGDEVVLERSGHSFVYESGALAALGRVQAHPVAGDRGLLSPEAVERAIRPAPDHYPRTSILVIENTSNGGGGTLYTPEQFERLARVARSHGLRVHLDGARLFNAHVALGAPLSQLAAPADTASVCLSKGLGAPVGSVVAGTKAFIQAAHRLRKMLGGGTRQAGILAAAGLYALDHHLERLVEDHRNLRRLTEGIAPIAGLACEPDAYPTNIAYVKVTRPGLTAAALAQRLSSEGVKVNAMSPDEIRVVTHLDVDARQIDQAIARIARVMSAS